MKTFKAFYSFLYLLALASLTALALSFVNDLEAAQPPTIVVLGDSISAEYGLPRNSGWVALMTQRLAKEGFTHRVVNASISGETTAGGRSRIKRLLAKHKPAILILELGGNDALRGLDLSNTQSNLMHIARASQQANAKLLVLGMQVPPNYGQAYTEQFAQIFVKVSQSHEGSLVPFFLSPIATDDKSFQADGIHPTASVQPLLLNQVWDTLVPLLKHKSQ